MGSIESNTPAINGNGNQFSDKSEPKMLSPRDHPQRTFTDTVIDASSFWGKVRTIYSSDVLLAQLKQIRESGCYEMFTGKWMPCYDTRRLKGGRALSDGVPPSMFWESDIGKWIESACYFLANPASHDAAYTSELTQAIDKLIGDMEAFQKPDGYLNVYFTVVDPAGRYQNLRDFHEMYNAGHLLEGAIAHYHWSGSRRFFDIMLKNVDCFMEKFGPADDQLPGYDGHPEFELALLRLYSITKDPRHLAFAKHLLSARGTRPASLADKLYFVWEAEQRGDVVCPNTIRRLDDLSYHQAAQPIHEQEAILGHAVRAMYLTTACADIGGPFLEDAQRLWLNSTTKKMYVTGGLGSVPNSEAFSELDYFLPSSTGEGGCYAETCASIGAMMVTERLLSHNLDGRYRDVLELCLYNAVLGGGSLDGAGFSYANKLATYGDETALRPAWYEVCCCPPNLSRTLGMLPGYIWSAKATEHDEVEVNVYLYITARRSIALPDGSVVDISMRSEMPWHGSVSIDVKVPKGRRLILRLPVAEWMTNLQFSVPTKSCAAPGYVEMILDSATTGEVSITFEMETRLVYPHPLVRQDTLSVMRGPIVFVAEDIDNTQLEEANPHFDLVGISESATFVTETDDIRGVAILRVSTRDVFTLEQPSEGPPGLYSPVRPGVPVRSWVKAAQPLTLIPWFARANRGGKGHVRVPFSRVNAP